jgi:hypothetical protein
MRRSCSLSSAFSTSQRHERPLVSSANPFGQVANLDPEVAATIVQRSVAVNHCDGPECTTLSGFDNAPGSGLAMKRPGVHKLFSACASALAPSPSPVVPPRLQLHFFCLLDVVNIMANEASRLLKLSDANLLTHFNAVCPQMSSWRSARLTIKVLCSVTSASRRRRVERHHPFACKL